MVGKRAAGLGLFEAERLFTACAGTPDVVWRCCACGRGGQRSLISGGFSPRTTEKTPVVPRFFESVSLAATDQEFFFSVFIAAGCNRNRLLPIAGFTWRGSAWYRDGSCD